MDNIANYKSRYLIKQIKITGIEEGGVNALESDLILKKNNLEVYCNADAITPRIDIKTYKEFEGKFMNTLPKIERHGEITKTNEKIKQIQLVSKPKYSFNGEIIFLKPSENVHNGKIISGLTIILDSGINLRMNLGPVNLSKLKKESTELKIGDYISVEGYLYLFSGEFIGEGLDE